MSNENGISLGLLGGIIGGYIGYLLRPSVPLLGQLPFEVVISKGSNLKGFDTLLIPTAEVSFNYLIIGIILGISIGWIVGNLLAKNEKTVSDVRDNKSKTISLESDNEDNKSKTILLVSILLASIITLLILYGFVNIVQDITPISTGTQPKTVYTADLTVHQLSSNRIDIIYVGSPYAEKLQSFEYTITSGDDYPAITDILGRPIVGETYTILGTSKAFLSSRDHVVVIAHWDDGSKTVVLDTYT